jgi:hypothetical protein
MTLTNQDVIPNQDARTAPGHHAQRAKLAKTNAGLSNIRTIRSTNITPLVEKLK